MPRKNSKGLRRKAPRATTQLSLIKRMGAIEVQLKSVADRTDYLAARMEEVDEIHHEHLLHIVAMLEKQRRFSRLKGWLGKTMRRITSYPNPPKKT